MYFLVKIKETYQKAIIPQKWILNLNWEKLLTYGKRSIKNTEVTVFICNDEGREPDFHLGVKSVLDTSRPSCYKAFVIGIFGRTLSKFYAKHFN